MLDDQLSYTRHIPHAYSATPIARESDLLILAKCPGNYARIMSFKDEQILA
jgi:hypothetical protein